MPLLPRSNMFYHNALLQTWLVTVCLSLLLLTACDRTEQEVGPHTLQEAREQMQAGEYRHALIKLKQFIQQNPEHADSRLLMAQLYLRQGNHPSAEIEIRKAMQLGLPRGNGLEVLGQSLIGQKRYDSVLNELQLLEGDDETLRFHLALLRGEAYLGKSMIQEARASFEQAQKIRPDTTEVQYGLARVLIQEKSPAGAQDHLRDVLKGHPDHMPSYLLLGDIELQAGDLQQALEAYEKALAIASQDIAARFKRAFVQLNLGNIAEAQQDLTAVLAKFPELPLANYLQARIYFLQGDMGKANDQLQKIFRADADLAPAHLLNGFVAMDQGLLRQAEGSLIKFLTQHPENTAVAHVLALVQLQFEEGPQHVVERLTAERKDAALDVDGKALLGVAYLKTGRLEQARAMLLAAGTLPSIVIRSVSAGLPGEEKNSAAQKAQEPAHEGRVFQQQEQAIYRKHFKKVLTDSARNWLQREGEAQGRHYTAGLLYTIQGEWADADEQFNAVPEQDADYVNALVERVKVSLRQRQWPEAEKRLALLLEKKPDYEEAWITWVLVAEAQGNLDEAMQRLRQAWERYPASRIIGLSLLSQELRQKNAQGAQQVEKALKAAHDKDAGLHRALGIIYLRTGDKAAAEQHMQRAIQRSPDDLENYLWLAAMRQQAGNTRGAHTAYDEVLRRKPSHPAALVAKTRLLLAQKDYSDAAHHARQLTRIYFDKAIGPQLEGDIALAQDQREEALKQYRQALERQPNDTVMAVYGQLLYEQGKQGEAIQALRNWTLRYPRSNAAQLMLAELYQRQQDPQQAIRQYLRMEREGLVSVASLNNLVYLFIVHKDARLAAYTDKLIAMQVKAPEVMDTIGWALLHLDKLQEAGPYLQQAAQQRAKDPSIQYHLAAYYARTGKKAEARDRLQALLKRYPEFGERREAQALYQELGGAG